MRADWFKVVFVSNNYFHPVIIDEGAARVNYLA